MEVSELCFQSISELAAVIKTRQVSPVEITTGFLERIQQVDGRLNSYITMVADQALQQASEAERQIAQGGYRGPLHGIPLAHKDIVATRGIRTTCGSKVLKDYVPDTDATVIARLQSAGTILLGKPFDEATVLQIGHAYELHTTWHTRRPPV